MVKCGFQCVAAFQQELLTVLVTLEVQAVSGRLCPELGCDARVKCARVAVLTSQME